MTGKIITYNFVNSSDFIVILKDYYGNIYLAPHGGSASGYFNKHTTTEDLEFNDNNVKVVADNSVFYFLNRD